MTKYTLFNLITQVTDEKYRGMERFPLHEFDFSSAEIDANPEIVAEYSDKDEALKALTLYECTARKKEGFNSKFWEFNLYYVQEIDVDEDGEEDWSGGAYFAPWENPEWEKNEYCDYSYYYNDEEEEEDE